MPSVGAIDPVAVRVALERQLALLVPVSDHLRRAAVDPSPLLVDEWSGAAADAAAVFLVDLRSLLRAADEAVDDTVRTLRLQIAQLP